MVDVQCLYSVASEVIPGNAARMCEFPWRYKVAPVCCGVTDNEHRCVCAELILEEATNALSHKMAALRLEKFCVSPKSSHQNNFWQYSFDIVSPKADKDKKER